MRKFKELVETVRVDKLVHGGQAIAQLLDGRKVFVWNALPGELVRIRVIKSKRSYAEAIATKVIEASPDRIDPVESNYLATSPWQIMTFELENKAKLEITKELFTQAHVQLPDSSITAPEEMFHYRNKMEYSFWGDDEGLHLALHQRGSHGKQIVQGSELAMESIDRGAGGVLKALSELNTRAGDLKTVIVRCDQQGNAVASLFVKTETFPALELPHGLKGLRVYYSNPQSPASVPTKLLQEVGDAQLSDVVLDTDLTYDVDSFFQVNLPIFAQALSRIREHVSSASLTDMYAGVGTIGLSVARERVNLIEFDPATVAMARLNAASTHLEANVVAASTEKVLEYISGAEPVIFDPPRAGLHANVVKRLLEVMPQQVVYLSCNPATQARDLALLQEAYSIEYFEVFNFFPRTPHIESLAILRAS